MNRHHRPSQPASLHTTLQPGSRASEDIGQHVATSFHKAPQSPRIAVIGIGGGGGQMISAIRAKFAEVATVIAINTNADALEKTLADSRILLLDHGKSPISVRNARSVAICQKSAIQSAMSNVDCALIAVGLGGVSGTGIAPVVAEMARELGIFGIAMYSMPAFFEAEERRENAAYGAEALKESADVVVPVFLDDLYGILDEEDSVGALFGLGNVAFTHFCGNLLGAFGPAQMLTDNVSNTRQLVNLPGRFAMGWGAAINGNRIQLACQVAMQHPLLGVARLRAARGVLVSIRCGLAPEPCLAVEQVKIVLRRVVNDEARGIVSFSEDRALGKTVQASIIACGIL